MYLDQNTLFSSVNLLFNHFIWQLLSCTLHVFPSLKWLVFCGRFSPWRNCTHPHLHADDSLSTILYSDARELLDFHAYVFFRWYFNYCMFCLFLGGLDIFFTRVIEPKGYIYFLEWLETVLLLLILLLTLYIYARYSHLLFFKGINRWISF